jgi:hypothetical protein
MRKATDAVGRLIRSRPLTHLSGFPSNLAYSHCELVSAPNAFLGSQNGAGRSRATWTGGSRDRTGWSARVKRPTIFAPLPCRTLIDGLGGRRPPLQLKSVLAVESSVRSGVLNLNALRQRTHSISQMVIHLLSHLEEWLNECLCDSSCGLFVLFQAPSECGLAAKISACQKLQICNARTFLQGG